MRISRTLLRFGFPRDGFLIPLAVLVGALAGLVAVGFGKMVEFSTEHLFGYYFANPLLFEGDRYLALVLLPAMGGLMVGIITHYARGKAGGHGIPDVIEALARRHGVLPKRSGLFKAVTASLTIGSGGSAGVEGPIIQIGSVLGSAVGQLLRVGREHMHTLVGCGAAGGMAAIFNAPIAGVLFVLEVILRDFSLKTFIPIVIASVFGTAIAQALTDNEAVLAAPAALTDHWEWTLGQIIPFAVLGILCGVVGVAFTRCMMFSETSWGKLKMHQVAKPMVGGIALGLLGLLYVTVVGQVVQPLGGDNDPPAFYGNGYPVIELLFRLETYDAGAGRAMWLFAGVLAATILFKIVGTSMTLGSGGSGGILAPSLFMGAALGGAFGSAAEATGWFGDLSPAVYALSGMAGVLAGTAHCPLTAFVLVTQMTDQYKAILPVMLVAILATSIAQIMSNQSIYSFWLGKVGIRRSVFSDSTVLRRLTVLQVQLTEPAVVYPCEPAQRLLDLAAERAVTDFVVCDEDDRYAGMVVGQDVRTTLLEREAVPLMIVGELMRANLPTVSTEQTLEQVLDLFAHHDVASLAVLDDHAGVVGVITRSKLIRRYQAALQAGV